MIRQYGRKRASLAWSVALTRTSNVTHEPPPSRGEASRLQQTLPKPGSENALKVPAFTSLKSIEGVQNFPTAPTTKPRPSSSASRWKPLPGATMSSSRACGFAGLGPPWSFARRMSGAMRMPNSTRTRPSR